MLPVLALAGAGQIADTVSASVSSLSRLLSGKSTDASSTSDPTSFASMLAAQGVGGAASSTTTAAVGGSLPAQPHVSAGGAALAGGHGHAGGHRAAHI